MRLMQPIVAPNAIATLWFLAFAGIRVPAEACKKERTKMRSLPSPKKHSKCRVEKANHEFMTTKPTLSQGWSNSLCLGRECQKDSGLVLLYQTETTREMVRYRGNID